MAGPGPTPAVPASAGFPQRLLASFAVTGRSCGLPRRSPNPSRCRQPQIDVSCRYSSAQWEDVDERRVPLKQLKVLEGAVDDPLLANPRRRLDMLGTGWFGVIVEYEGVLVESAHEEHVQAWREVCRARGANPPPHFLLERTEGMKSEQVITEVLLLSRNPEVVRQIADEKEKVFQRLRAGRPLAALPGAERLLQTLVNHGVPVAVTGPAQKDMLVEGLQRTNLSQYVDTVVAGEDVSHCRPDPEQYLTAAYALGRPPARCVVIGSANTAVEAAHTEGMRCVAVASRLKMYELVAADLVVRDLEAISLHNLKQMFGMEEGRAPILQEEEEVSVRSQEVGVADWDEDDGSGAGAGRYSGGRGALW